MKKFRRVYVEITNVCNLRCSFCPPTRRKNEFMTIDNFKCILDKVKNYTDYLYFHVKGEPLLHPNIGEFLDISEEKGFKVNITTNGTLIEKVKDKLLDKPALRQISFSLQSSENQRTMVEKENYIKNILEFTKEANQKTNINIELRLWNLSLDQKENGIEKNSDILTNIEESLNLPFELKEEIYKDKGIEIKKGIYLSQSYEFEWPNLNREDISSIGFCQGLRNQIGILVDGTVIPCCLDSEGIINLGNIFNLEFEEIVEGKRARNIVEGFSRREVVEPLCRKCGFRKRFDKNNFKRG